MEYIPKINDVLKVDWLNPPFIPNHCFDGYLIYNGKFFKDTYWGFDDTQSKGFIFEEVKEKFKWYYYFNFDEVEKFNKYDKQFYNERDIYFIGEQHGCRPHYYLRRGAQKSKEVMVKYCENKIRELEEDINFKQNSIKNFKESLEKIKNGVIEGLYL